MLNNTLLPFVLKYHPSKYFFHASKETKTWLSDMKLNTMSWPACSSDLNPIGNKYLKKEVGIRGVTRSTRVSAQFQIFVIAAELKTQAVRRENKRKHNQIEVDYIKKMMETGENAAKAASRSCSTRCTRTATYRSVRPCKPATRVLMAIQMRTTARRRSASPAMNATSRSSLTGRATMRR
eukprot:IDg22315t1